MDNRSKSPDTPSIHPDDIRTLAYTEDPYSLYRHMREQEPRSFSSISKSWRLTRHADITAVLRDERFGLLTSHYTLPSWRAVVTAPTGSPRSPQDMAHHWFVLQSKVFELRQHWILLQNPPAHTRLRALVQPLFGLTTVSRHHAFIQATADALIDRFQERGEADLAGEYAAPLMLQVIWQFLGLPPGDKEKLGGWTKHLGHFLHSDVVDPQTVDYQRMGMTAVGMTEYFRRLLDARREPYGEDMMDTLHQNLIAEKLSEDELLAMCLLLTLGGYGTTQNMIGNALVAFLRHPEQWELLKRQPDLLASAVEECLRYDTSGQTAGRKAYADVELDGTHIRKGNWVNLVLGAGNHDPEVFADPERFDITRTVNPQLSFGHGMHYCLGAHLARATLRTAISTVARRLPNLQLQDAPLEWRLDSHHRGLKAVRVVF